MGAIAVAFAPAAGAQRTSVGEAAGGHAGGAERASDGNHCDGVGGRSGDDLGMNWRCNGCEVVGLREASQKAKRARAFLARTCPAATLSRARAPFGQLDSLS